MKKINIFKAVVIALVFIIPGSVFANSEPINTMVSIEPSAQIVEKGETFNISIDIIPSEPITGITLNYLYYDSNLIHANSVSEGNLFENYLTFEPGTIDNNIGVITDISLQALSQDAVNESGSFVNISFTTQNELGTSVLDIEEITIINLSSISLPLDINDGKVAVGWSVLLHFIETSGKMDYVIFGETTDANDGGEPDSYDVPKAPTPPEPPYIRTRLDDNLPTPYNILSEDYRRYPDNKKIWNLSVQWESTIPNPTNITISWDNSFTDCEYNSIILTRYNPFEDEWEFATDMLLEDNYIYAPRYFSVDWLTDHFKITTLFDILPPEITNIVLTPSNPIDTEPGFGWENISCTIIDEVSGIDEVKIVVTDPDTITTEYLMTHIPSTDIYYYNTTFSNPGCYNYHIWTNDIMDNNGTSESHQFELPPNHDVDMDGKTHLTDLGLIAIHWNDEGPPGWIREDVDNDGKVHLTDLGLVAIHWNEYWDTC